MSRARLAQQALPVGRLRALQHDRTLRDTVLVFANNLIGAVGGMLFWFLATRRYDAGLVGVVSAGTSLAILLAGLGQMGLGMGLIRYGDALGPARVRRLWTMFGLIATASWLAGMLFVLGAPAVAPALGPLVARPLDAALIAATCTAWALSVQADNYLLSRRLTGLLAVKGLITAAARPLLLFALAAPSPTLLVGLTGLSGLLGIVVTAPFVTRCTHTAAVATVSDRELLRFSLWNYVGGVAGTLPALLLPAMVVSMVAPEAAGAYYLAWTLFSALLFAPAALGWVRFAEGAAGSAAKGALEARRGEGPLLLLAGLFLPLALGVLALLGPHYLAGGWPVLLALCAGFWPYCRAQALVAAIRLGGLQWRLTLAAALSHVAILILALPLLRLLGAPGAALAWSLGQGLYVAALRWAVRRPGGAL